jgi:hypothetical protein
MSNKIRLRRDTKAAWDSNNPTLLEGEPGYISDSKIIKLGDGSTAWASLRGLPQTGFCNYKAVSSDNYTVLDDDGYSFIGFSTGSSERTVTLPTLNDNLGRRLRIAKTDTGAGEVKIDGEGSELLLYPGGSALVLYLGIVNQYVDVEVTPSGWLLTGGVIQPVSGEPDIGGGWHPHNYAIMNLDPSDTNWHEIDLSTQVPLGSLRITKHGYFVSSTASSYGLVFSDSSGGTVWDQNILPHVVDGYGNLAGTIKLSSTRTFWYQAESANVGAIHAWMSGYILGPA